jgi:hypothetical protein
VCQTDDWKVHRYTCSANVDARLSEGRGKCLFALKAFAVGDELIREKPLIVCSSGQCAFNMNSARGFVADAEVTRLVEALPDAERTVIMALHDAHTDPDDHPATAGRSIFFKSLSGIAQTNCIPLGSGAAEKAGLFALTCRINHSCPGAANAHYVWREDLGSALVFAMRPIAPGEEITVTYNDGYLPLAQRRTYLQNTFGFVCTCDACANSCEEIDERLRRIQSLIDEVPKVGYTDQHRALKMCEQVLGLMKQEGIDTPVDLGRIHYDAYQMARASGSKRKAQEHIRKAWECAKLSDGDLSPLAASYGSKIC